MEIQIGITRKVVINFIDGDIIVSDYRLDKVFTWNCSEGELVDLVSMGIAHKTWGDNGSPYESYTRHYNGTLI